MSDDPNHALTAPTAIADGITLETTGTVAIYTLHTVSAAPIEAWIAHVIAALQSAPTDQRFLALYDFSHVSMFGLNAFQSYTIGSLGMTDSGNRQVNALTTGRSAKARLAVVMPPSLSARVTKLISKQQMEAVDTHFFFTRETALTWLNRVD